MLFRLTVLLLLLMPTFAWAQDSIFVPLEPDVSVQKTESGDALSQYVQLQTGLEQIVLSFDEQAKRVAKETREFEKTELKKRQELFLNSELAKQPPKKRTYEEQVQYDLLFREPTLCFSLNEALRAYVTENTSTLDDIVQQLKLQSAHMDEAAKRAFAERLGNALKAANPRKYRAQEILYQCLHKTRDEQGKQRDYSVEKTMRNWFLIQQPLITSWIGNID